MDTMEQLASRLRERRDTLTESVKDTLDEIARLDKALAVLGVPSDPKRERSPSSSTTVPTRPVVVDVPPAKLTVKDVVAELLESEEREWGLDEIVDGIRGVQGARTDEQFRSSVRTALWSLRKTGQAVLIRQGYNIAGKFAQQHPDYAFRPQDASDPDDQKSSGSEDRIAAIEEGGGGDPTSQSPGGDPPGRDSDRGDRAVVGGWSS